MVNICAVYAFFLVI